MHVLQYLAVKADSAEEAIDNVRTELENRMGEAGSGATWYDWFVAGGGRWNTGDSDDFQEAYKEGKTNMIVSTDNLDEFLAVLEKCIENRVSEFQRYRDEWQRANINLESYFDMYDGDMDYSMKLYPLGKMIDMAQGEWDYNSYFYDLENWSTNPIHMTKDRINVGGVWYLVPVDFHF